MQKARIALMLLLIATCLAPGAATATAAASSTSPTAIVDSCEHNGGQLTGHYTAAELQAAYNHISTVNRTYVECASTIFSQLQTELHHHLGDGGGSGSGFPWIIVIIVVIVVLGGGGAAWAYWRNRAAGPPSAGA